ncbi:ATP-binding protein [Streptomyces sp. MMG1121]|uniref:ATP-binding protein n=1 Tax=Streptomyces sp. MMG1121 TaxID=1415544 RepID=UPI0007C6F8FA|nr:tetratricopeptide repeat protein [Streptomyces sp. MMG1121]
MEAELGTLAAQAATAVVGLAVTDAWLNMKHVRRRVTRWLSRRGADGELDAVRDELAAARRHGDEESAADRVAADWERRLLGILEDDPEAAEELRRLLAEVLPGTSYDIAFDVPSNEPAAPGAQPDQLPTLTGTFSNRIAELDRMDALCGAPGRVNLAVLAGLPGVGKTAIACRWADKERARFPDGLFYVDYGALRDESAVGPAMGPAMASQALASILRALLGSDAHVSERFEELRRQYLNHSRDRRMLVLIDNVTLAAQVRALIPAGHGSTVMVTSHTRLGELVAVDGAELIALEPLDTQGGLKLLTDQCGEAAVAAEPVAAEHLVDLCGGLPVALRIVATRLATGDAPSLTYLAQELADEAERLEGLSLPGGGYSLSAVLGPSYRLLPPAAARMFRLLGWLPAGLFDESVAAAAAGVDRRTARRLLRELAATSLLEIDRDGRYRVHDLVRLYARERAVTEERPAEETALIERVTTHYLVLAAFADRARRADRLRVADLTELLERATDPFSAPGGPAPLTWLDAECPAILAVLRAAVRHRLYGLAWPLAEAFTVLFLHHRHLGAWKESLSLGVEAAAAEAAAAEAADPAAGTGTAAEALAGEARLRSLLSRPLTDLGEHDAARTELERAVALAEPTDRLLLRASVQEFHGRHLERFAPARAVETYRYCLDLNRRAQDRRGEALALLFLGSALDAQGDHDQALALLGQARADLLNLPEPDGRMAARALRALGRVHAHREETDEAFQALEAAADSLKEHGAYSYEADALEDLADLAERTGRHPDRVRAWLTRALAIHEANGSLRVDVVRRRLEDLS